MISYRTNGKEKGIQPVVSSTEFNRNMSQIAWALGYIKTIAFPNTVREVLDQTLSRNCLKSVVLNEGLEILGKNRGGYYAGVFSGARLKRVVLPSTLRALGDNAFVMCYDLREVVFGEEGSLKEIGRRAFCYCSSLKRIDLPEGLEIIGECVFESSGLEVITFPGTLKEVHQYIFKKCLNIKTAYVRDSVGADYSPTGVQYFATVGPPENTLVGGTRVWDLRKQKDVIIPEGTERIGNYWFYGTGIESVTVPASVREIGTDAFRNCKNIKRIQFQNDSALEKIGIRCFQESALERITIPKGVKGI